MATTTDDTPKDETPERECAWSGETRQGKFYILQTTEGTELVHADALADKLGGSSDDLVTLMKTVDALKSRVAKLEKQFQDQDADKQPGDDDQEQPKQAAASRSSSARK
jgi:hypothetical protein